MVGHHNKINEVVCSLVCSKVAKSSCQTHLCINLERLYLYMKISFVILNSIKAGFHFTKMYTRGIKKSN